METEATLFEIIEKYHRGELSSEERLAFEQKRALDADFDAKAVAHIHFLDELKSFHDLKLLKNQLNQIHQRLDTPALVNDVKSVSLKFKEFVQKYKLVTSAAACIVAITSVSMIFVNNHSNKSGNMELMMRREVDNIKKSQNNLVHKINNIEKGINLPKPEKFSGTGFVISTSGYILTNYHVINGADSLYIENEKGDVYKVKTVTANPEYDLAILKIEDSKFKKFDELPYSFKNTTSLLGERVYTLGYPKDEPVYGEGYLSANTGFNNDTTSYQIALSVNPGNSGGPLFNDKGEIIGVISGKQAQMDGFTFAVKSKYLYHTIRDLNEDSLTKDKVYLSKRNLLVKSQRTNQIQKIKNYVFMVKVYN